MVQPERTVSTVLKVLPETTELMAPKGRRVRLVLTVQLEQTGSMVPTALTEPKVLPVTTALMDRKVLQVMTVRMARKALRVPTELMALTESKV